MICHIGVASHTLLAQHLKLFHLQERPYSCVHCSVNFKTYPDLGSHISNIHKTKKIKCKLCTYKTVSCSRMLAHVGKHTPCYHCKQCSKVYPTKCALKHHQTLHGTREEHQCADCDQVYVTASSLTLHYHGEHGEGFCVSVGIGLIAQHSECVIPKSVHQSS